MASPKAPKFINFHWSTIEAVDKLRGNQTYADWFALDPRLEGHVASPPTAATRGRPPGTSNSRLTGIVDAPVQPVAVPPPAAPVNPPPVASPPRATMKDLFGGLDPVTGKALPRQDWLLRHADGTVENHSLTYREAGALAASLCGEAVTSVFIPSGEGFTLWYDGDDSGNPSATLFPA